MKFKSTGLISIEIDGKIYDYNPEAFEHYMDSPFNSEKKLYIAYIGDCDAKSINLGANYKYLIILVLDN